MRTLVQIIWSLAKLGFNDDKGQISEVLNDLKSYPRLVDGLEGMYQKSQCMLLWTYSRSASLLDKEFLAKVIDALLGYQGQVFDLDNFDLLLIIQAASHLERSPEVSEDFEFMSKLAQLAQMADTFVI